MVPPATGHPHRNPALGPPAIRTDRRGGPGAPTVERDMTTYAERIRAKLTEALSPVRLDVVDDSARHAGHAGADPLGETHFQVTVVSASFAGKSRVARQRLVYDALAAEMAERVHALSLRTLAPDEDPE